MDKEKNIFTFFKRLVKISKFSCQLGMNPSFLIVPAILSFIAVVLEGAGTALLVPVLKGIFERNYEFAQTYPVVREVIPLLSRFVTERSAAFIILIGSVFCLLVGKSAVFFLVRLQVSYKAEKLTSNLRKHLFERFLLFGKLFFDRSSRGYLQEVFSTIQVVPNLVFNMLRIFHFILEILIYVILMSIISWKLLLVVLIEAPFIYLSANWLIRKIKKMSLGAIGVGRELFSSLSNVLACLPIVKAYLMEEKEKEAFFQKCDSLRGWSCKIQKSMALVPLLQEAIMFSGLFILVSAATFIYTTNTTVEVSRLLVFLYLVKRCVENFNHLSMTRASIAQQAGKISEISGLLNDEQKFFVPEGGREFKGIQKKIVFNNLKFFYTKRLLVLQGIDFTVEKGKMTAIVGPTGAGKTTIINVLLRFYDCNEGGVMIDGVDLRDFSPESLYKHIAFVGQENFIFNDTIKNNICYGSVVSEKKINEVIKKAHLENLIQSLPGGLSTVVGDQGVKLSGGEKQRVSIARAMIKDSEILILDEATSSLDTQTEKGIQQAINEAVKGKTVIVIAHRLSTIKNADKLVVVDKGRVVEQGTLQELIENKGLFCHMWEVQKFD